MCHHFTKKMVNKYEWYFLEKEKSITIIYSLIVLRGRRKKSRTSTCIVALTALCLHPCALPEYLHVGQATAETNYQQPADRINRT